MRKKFARLAEIKIRNGKSVENGEVIFTDMKKFTPEEISNESSVFGIYGQNRSGKSTLVEAIAIAHDLISGNRASLINKDFVTKWKDVCECSFSFVLQMNDKVFYCYEYCISFKKNDPENSERPYVLEKESLVVKKYSFELEKRRINKAIPAITVDFSSVKSLFLENYYNKKFSRNEKLSENKTLCKNDLKSFIFSKELLTYAKEKRFNSFYSTVASLKNYCAFDLFVFSNDESSMAMLNYISLCDRNETNDGIGAGKLKIDINETSQIRSENYDVIERCIGDMNSVLPSIIPDFKLELNYLGEYTNDRNELMTKFEVFSVVNDSRIPLRSESAGVKKIVAICSVLIDVFNDPSVCLVIDEIDSGVFEYLLGQLTKVFDNYAKGQIIFTAHNSRALECLPTKQIIFTTVNPNRKYIRMKKVKPTNNLRDFYFRAIVLGGQDEELYESTSENKIARTFGILRRKADGK